METASSGQPAVRTKTTTVWLWIVLVLNVIVGFMSFSLIGTMTGLGLSPVPLIIGALMSFGVAVGAYMIMQWKKMGFYIIAGCVVINILVAIFGGGNAGSAIGGGLLSLGILYYVLQYPKDNKAWSHLV
jgi:hypothetical protein